MLPGPGELRFPGAVLCQGGNFARRKLDAFRNALSLTGCAETHVMASPGPGRSTTRSIADSYQSMNSFGGIERFSVGASD